MFLLMEHGVEHNIWDGRFGLLPHKSQFTHPHERLPSSLHGRAQCLSRKTHDIKALIENAMGSKFIFMWVNRLRNLAAHLLPKWGDSHSFFSFFKSSESSSKFFWPSALKEALSYFCLVFCLLLWFLLRATSLCSYFFFVRLRFSNKKKDPWCRDRSYGRLKISICRGLSCDFVFVFLFLNKDWRKL